MNRKITSIILVLFSLFGAYRSFGQQPKTDSLNGLLQNETRDIKKAGILTELSEQYIISGDFDLAREAADKAFVICETNLSGTNNNETTLFLKEKANAYNMIAIVHRYRGDYPKAIENHLLALKIREEIGDKKGIARSHLGLGSIHRFQGDYEQALEDYAICEKIYKEIGNKWGIANSLIHIGDVYKDLENYPEALKNYFEAEKHWHDLDARKGVAEAYNSIGLIYSREGRYAEAMKYYLSSLKINENVEFKDEIIKTYTNLGLINIRLQQYEEAKKYLDKATTVARSIGSRDDLKEIYKALAEMETKQRHFEEALGHYKSYILIRDSLVNQSSSEKITAMQMQYAQNKKDSMVEEEKRRQKIITYAVTAGLILVLLLALVILRGSRQKQRSNLLLSEKNKVIEEKNRNITDSISYAKRIQEAILPSKESVKKQIPENFILYRPKDIVAGDFYWMEQLGDYIYVAAADSTGHGVPGAMVSVVCSNALNRAAKEFGLRNTGEILDKTRELVIETFAKSDEEVKDGMDISLIRINKQPGMTVEIQWSGANNSLLYFTGTTLHEIKANKRPIGKHSDPTPFTTHTFSLPSLVSFYLFSDGYADQFSAANKKLMTRNFKEILVSIQQLSMEEQDAYLGKYHDEWKGATEQTDDVLVIGLRV